MRIHMKTSDDVDIFWCMEIGRCSKYLQKQIAAMTLPDGADTYGVFSISATESTIRIIERWAQHYRDVPSYDDLYNRGGDDEKWDSALMGELDLGRYFCSIC